MVGKNGSKSRVGWIASGGIAAVLAAHALVQLHGNAEAVPPVMRVAFRKEKDDRVEELMERVHEGKRSPLARTKAQLATDTPNWDELEKQMAAFSKMSTALKQSPVVGIRDSADGYADAVKALSTAVKQRNRNMARSSLKALTSSCADCHYEGGPGGELDDDD